MKIKFLSLLLACRLLAPPGLIRAEEDPKKPWKDTAELSYVSTRGNSDTTAISFENKFRYDWKKFALGLDSGAYGSESDDRTTAENYYASEKVDYKLTKRTYVFEKYRWTKDRFAGIDARHDAQTGFGHFLIRTKRHKFNFELGVGYINEDRVNERNKDYANGRSYGKYEHALSNTATFSQDAEYTHSFEDRDDYIFRSETALIAAINSIMSLKVGYKINRVNQPPPNIAKTDTITSAALIFNY